VQTTEPVVVYRTGKGSSSGARDADPITTEVVRHALNSAAGQMKWALVQTAFSPIIYEVLDFGVAIYDRQIRLLAQAPSLPIFMGTMSFCVEAAIEGVGGEEALEPGDIILYNWPYGVGSHAQDSALVMPIFAADQLIGYAAIKEHWLDIGAKAPYCTDTTDVFQEGTFFPGVKLVSKGTLVRDIYRTVLANSRMPNMLMGDLNAQMTGVRAGADAMGRIVERYGLERVKTAVEHMFDHGERIVRQCIEALPDGRYAAWGEMDNNGVDSDRIPFEVSVEIKGSVVVVDFSKVPDQQGGPINCPFPSTVSATRLAMTLFAGGGEAPNEGMCRPVEVITRPGSMFHPIPPAPCFLYAWPAAHAVDVIYRALGQAVPERMPAGAGGDVLGIVSWGITPSTGQPWGDGPPHPAGQGGHARGDGASALQCYAMGCGRLPPAEVYETKTQWMIVKEELAQDSCGPGKHRGGLGIDKLFQSVHDSTWVTPAVERTIDRPWGIQGGLPGRANHGLLHLADGTTLPASKGTLNAPTGAVFALHTGGGGGFGDPAERDPDAVREDIRNGYISEGHARDHYPQAFA
jgi:N-methylhydantoinase B